MHSCSDSTTDANILSYQGLELGGAVKNVIALAAGMCEGLGLGMNAMSSIVTSGCLEMGR